MRRIGAVAGLAVALAALPVHAEPAQPSPPPAASPTSGWRAAVKAALAFGHAEGKAAALARFRVPSAPMSKRGTEAALDQLDHLASGAREAYAAVEKHGSPPWTVAAEVRIGDTLACQVEKMRAMPWPTGIAAAVAQYPEVFDGMLDPLREQARRHWERAAAAKHESRYWSGVAWERLRGAQPPDC